MKLVLLITLIVSVISHAAELPREIESFVTERDLCDHFRGEDFEGSGERAVFVRDSLDIYCSGTDLRLAALKRRYREEKNIIDLLSNYEETIEN